MSATRRDWFKSSFSLSGVNCVEVRHLPGGGVVVRDTKAGGAGPELCFTAGEWQAFLAGVRAGEFDAGTGPADGMRVGTPRLGAVQPGRADPGHRDQGQRDHELAPAGAAPAGAA